MSSTKAKPDQCTAGELACCAEPVWGRRGVRVSVVRVRTAGDFNVGAGSAQRIFFFFFFNLFCFGTCAHPVGQSSNSFSRSFTAPTCHHTMEQAAGYAHAPMRPPCLLLRGEQHAGVPAEREPRLRQISALTQQSYGKISDDFLK